MRHDIRQLTEQLREENFIPNSFIEIGSRDGHDTNYICYYWKLNPNNCYIIEAHPKCYEFIQNTYPQYNSFNIAASNKTKVVKFNAGIFGEEENIGISSLLDMNIGSFISEQIEVDAWRMDEVMGHFNIDKFDFMKIDVEGFGFEVLQGFSDKIKQTKYIQIELEVSQVWENQSCYDDIVNYLKNQGFEILDEVDLDGIQKDVLFKNINYDFNSNS
jgi:FkbM family methyltransferase